MTIQWHTVVNKMRSVLKWLAVVLVSFVLVVQLFTLNIERYKSALETAIGEAAGVTVRIGQLRSKNRGWFPELILDDVEIVPADSRQDSVVFKQVRLGLDGWALIKTQSLISASHVQLLGADISVTRNQHGAIQITGFNSQGDQPLWLLQVGAVDVFESQVVFQDEMTGGPVLRFENIKLWLNNRQQPGHEIRMQFDLPRNLGHTAIVAIQLQGSGFSSQELTGNFYVRSDQVNVSTLTHLTSLLDGQGVFLSGLGGLEVWGDFKRSVLTRLSGRVDLSHLNVFDNTHHQAYLKSVASWFQWRQTAGGSYLDFRQLTVDNGIKSWPENNLSVRWSEDTQMGGYQVGLSLAQMPLAKLSESSDFLGALKLHSYPQLKKWALSGIIQELNLDYHTISEAVSVEGRLDDVGFLPIDNYPGLKHLSAHFSGTEQHIQINVDSQGVRYFDRNVFAKPVAIQSLTGVVDLRSEAKRWVLSSDDVALTIDLGVFHNRFQLIVPKAGDETFLSFQSQIKAVQAQKIAGYLPVGLLDGDLTTWLQQAFLAGELEQADFLFHGPVAAYPFLKGDGVLEALLDINGLGLQYEPQWPVFTGIDARILFVNDAMYGVADQWLLNGSAVLDSEFLIPSLTQSDHVWVKGEVVGKVEKTIGFLVETPLKPIVKPLVDRFSVQGKNHLFLDMKIPIVLSADAHVNGLARLTDTSLALSSVNFVVQKINGELGFSGQGLYTPGAPLKGEALGFPVSAEVKNLSEATQVVLKGYTDVNHLDAFFPSKGWSLIKGGSDYQLAIVIPNEPQRATQLRLFSNLTGMQEQFSDQKAPLDADFQAVVKLDQASVYEAQLSYGAQLKAALLIDAQTQQLNAAHVMVGEGIPDRPTQPGFVVTVKKEQLDLERWLGVAQRLEGSHALNWNTLNLLTVEVGKLTLKSGELAPVALSLNQQDGLLLGDFKAGNTQGTLRWPVNLAVDETINLDLKTFDILEVNDFYQQLEGGGGVF